MDQDVFDSLRKTVRVLQGRIHTLESQMQAKEQHHLTAMKNFEMRLHEKDRLLSHMDKELDRLRGDLLVVELENQLLTEKLSGISDQ